MPACLMISNITLNMLKLSGSADIDFLSVIHAKIVNIAKQAGLVTNFSHVARLFEFSFLSVKVWLSPLVARNEVPEGRYLKVS
jgi:hypothetical protein